MAGRHHPRTSLVALLAAAAFIACENASPVGPDDLAPAFNKGGGGGKDKNGGGKGTDGDGGSGTVTVELTGAAAGVHAGKNFKETNRQVEISGGPQASTTFNFGSEACVARHGSPDGAPVDDDATLAELYYWLTATVTTGVHMTYDVRSDGLPSAGHDLSFNFFDASGSAVNVAIFAHGSPAPTIHRDGGTFEVSGGQVRVWLRDGPPKNHPKLFCTNSDKVVLTVQ